MTNTTDTQSSEVALPSCDGWCDKKNPVTHIGSKGYVYCPECAVRRRQSGYERTRKMTAAERRTIASGQPIARY